MDSRKSFGRFMDKVDITTNPNGCWEWKGSKSKRGYGWFWDAGKNHPAHRIGYGLFHIIPSDMLVCHHCDNPACVRPSHLYLGSCKDNLQDMVFKGRSSFGERNGRSKLKEAEVVEIRRLWGTGKINQIILGAMFGVTNRSISMIVRSETWNRI